MLEQWLDWLGLILLAGLLDAAILLFVRIQGYLNDPARAAKNDEWFAQHEQHLRERYQDGALRWRTDGLSKHFHRERSRD